MAKALHAFDFLASPDDHPPAPVNVSAPALPIIRSPPTPPVTVSPFARAEASTPPGSVTIWKSTTAENRMAPTATMFCDERINPKNITK